MKFKPALLAFLITAPAYGQEYQSITSFDYIDHEIGDFSTEITSANSVFFLEKKRTLGPLDEFDFINTTSFVYAALVDSDADTAVGVGGTFFAGNFKFGATAVDEQGVDQLTFGYLFNDNFIVNLHANRDSDDDTALSLSSQYKISLSDENYVGLTFKVDEDFDFPSVGAKYFTSLGGDTYLTAGVDYIDTPVSDFYAVNVGYFFTKGTSLKVRYDDDETTGIRFKHFFNENFALAIDYQESDEFFFNGFEPDTIESDTLGVNFSMQF